MKGLINQIINKSINIKNHICLTLHASDASSGQTGDVKDKTTSSTDQKDQQKITVDGFMKLAETEAGKLKIQFNNFCKAIDNINGETNYAEEIKKKDAEIQKIKNTQEKKSEDTSNQEDINNETKALQILQIQQKIAKLMFEFDDTTNKVKGVNKEFYKNSIEMVQSQLKAVLSNFKFLNEIVNDLKDIVKSIDKDNKDGGSLLGSISKKGDDACSIFQKNINFITIENIDNENITDKNFNQIKTELKEKVDQASDILETELNRLKDLIEKELSNAEKEKKKYQSTLEEFQKKNTWTAKDNSSIQTKTEQQKVEHALHVLKEAQKAFDTELKATFTAHKVDATGKNDFDKQAGVLKECDTEAKYMNKFKDDVSAIKKYSKNNIEELFTDVKNAKDALKTAWTSAHEEYLNKIIQSDVTIAKYTKNLKAEIIQEKKLSTTDTNKNQDVINAYAEQIKDQNLLIKQIDDSLNNIKFVKTTNELILKSLNKVKILKSEDLSNTKIFKECASIYRSIYGLDLFKHHYNNYFSNIGASLANLYTLKTYNLEPCDWNDDNTIAVVHVLGRIMNCDVIKRPIAFPTEFEFTDTAIGENFFTKIDVKTLYFKNETHIKDVFTRAIADFADNMSNIDSNSGSGLVQQTIDLFNIHMGDSTEEMKNYLTTNVLNTIELPEQSKIFRCAGDSASNNKGELCEYLEDQTECRHCKKQSPDAKTDLHVVHNKKAVSASDNNGFFNWKNGLVLLVGIALVVCSAILAKEQNTSEETDAMIEEQVPQAKILDQSPKPVEVES